MPIDALPQQWDAVLNGTVHYRREYRDVLGRPLAGKATITGSAETDGQVIATAPVVVDIPAGVLEVDLPPDTYRISVKLRTAEGASVTGTDTITLEG